MSHCDVIAHTLREHREYIDPQKQISSCICGWENDGSGSWPNHAAAQVEAEIKARWSIVPRMVWNVT